MRNSTDSAASPLPSRGRRASAFDIVVVAASLGGLSAISHVLAAIPAEFPAPIVVVQHLSPRFPSALPELLSRSTASTVSWARPGERARAGSVYIAPPDHHLTIGAYGRFRLSQGIRVQFSRPSADVLFISAAQVYQERVLAVVLTGGQCDGAQGIRAIKRCGGRALAQDAATAAAFGMPGAAIATGCVDFVLPLGAIAPALVTLTMVPGAADFFRTTPPGAA